MKLKLISTSLPNSGKKRLKTTFESTVQSKVNQALENQALDMKL